MFSKRKLWTKNKAYISIVSFCAKVIVICLLYTYALSAQPPRLDVGISRQRVVVGDTLMLRIRSEYAASLRQELSGIGDTLGAFEVLSRSEPTIITIKELQHFAQDITLIVFDAGNFVIPSFNVPYVNQESGATNTIATNPIPVYVDSIAVDMQQDIKPIKPPIDIPFTWRDYLPYILIILGIIAAIIAFIWYRRRPKKAPVKEAIPPAPPRPAAEIALGQLQILAQARYWQQGEVKRYYSELSDIMRQYIDNRFHINAPEQTTDEIIEDLQEIHQTTKAAAMVTADNTPKIELSMSDELATTEYQEPIRIEKPISQQQITLLRQLLQTADMVKFAKAKPDIATHAQMLEVAEQWVRRTKVE